MVSEAFYGEKVSGLLSVAGRVLRCVKSGLSVAIRVGKTLALKVLDVTTNVDFYSKQVFGKNGMRAMRVGGLVLLVVLPTVFFAQNHAFAGIGQSIGLFFANIVQLVVWFLGWLVTQMIWMLVLVASYNEFAKSPAVANGWVLVRDLVNMFFVISLLIMSFGIMLNVGKYASMDPGKEIVKLATAAVLVNFSRTICGLLIDLSQVVMLTFVYGFKETAGGNFLEALGLNDLMQLAAKDTATAQDIQQVLISLMLAAVLLWITLGVVCIMTIMLAVRVVHLWVLVTISPIAFMPDVVSKIEGIKKQWWDAFSEALFFGPLMAFFLWLSLLSVAGGTFTTGFVPTEAVVGSNPGMTPAFDDSNIIKFIVATCLLMVGSAKAKSMAGAIGTQATSAASTMKKGAKWGLKKGAMKLGSTKLGEKALSLATRAPLVSGLAMDALGGVRDARLAKKAKQDARIAKLRPEEQEKVARGYALTKEAKLAQQAALMAVMENAKKKPPITEKEIENHKKDRAKLEKSFGSELAVKQRLKEVDRALPQLIKDDSIVDPVLRAANLAKFQLASKHTTGASVVASLDTLDLNDSPDVLQKKKDAMLPADMIMNMGENALLTAMNGSAIANEHIKDKLGANNKTDQALFEAAKTDAEKAKVIKGWQQRSKQSEAGFIFANDEEKQNALSKLSEKKPEEQKKFLDKLNAADLYGKDGKVLGNLQFAQMDDVLTNKLVDNGLTAGQLTDKDGKVIDEEMVLAMATAVAANKELSNKLSPELAKLFTDARVAAAGDDPSGVLAAGGSAAQAFGAYDVASGSFESADARSEVADFLNLDEGGGIGNQLSQFDSSYLGSNKGLNDVMVAALGNDKFDADTVRGMVSGKNSEKGLAVLEALNGIAAMSSEEFDDELRRAVSEASANLDPKLSPADLTKEVKKIESTKRGEMMKASEIINELKGGGEAGDYAPMTFKQKKSFAKDTRSKATKKLDEAAGVDSRATENNEKEAAADRKMQERGEKSLAESERKEKEKNMTKEERAEEKLNKNVSANQAAEKTQQEKLDKQADQQAKDLEDQAGNRPRRKPRS